MVKFVDILMVKFKMLTKEGIKIKDGKIIDFDKEKFYF